MRWRHYAIVLFCLGVGLSEGFTTGGRTLSKSCQRIDCSARMMATAVNGQEEANGKENVSSSHALPLLHRVPRHVAFICDGNSRWAEARGLPSSAGHAAGADRLMKCLETLKELGVECCTMYGFSTENWKRSEREIRDILRVIEDTGDRFYARALRENVRVKILGNVEDERIPPSLRSVLQKLEKDTSRGGTAQQLTVCLAINYGGRQDIVNAGVRMAKAVAAGDIDAADITEETVASYLYTADVPDPDLIIRTGGEQRLSNFLLWNMAYAELYFSNTLWPDFDGTCVREAIGWYSSRSRRFGGRVNALTTPTR